MPRRLPLAALLLLAACGGDAEGPIDVSVIGPPPALADPDAGRMDAGARLLLSSVAEGLVAFDAAGQIEPALAERWMVTDDGLSYIFRLRDARWPDGTPVTAREVQRMLRRALARASDNVLKTAVEAVVDIVVVTPEVLEIRLRTARPPLLELLAQPEFALVGRQGGAGPFRIVEAGAVPLVLAPSVDPGDAAAEEGEDAEDTTDRIVRLRGGRAALAVARFVGGEAELVLGGTLADLPVARAAEPGDNLLRFDPAAGLMALQVVTAEGFLADPLNRAAVAMAIRRDRIAAVLAVPGWEGVDTILPDAYRSSSPPAAPPWGIVPPGGRRTVAAAQVAAWSAEEGAPAPIRIAMPAGAGGTLLWGLIAADLTEIGLTPVRVAPGAAADLRLVDEVAPAGSAIWYLGALGCPADGVCDPAVAEALAAARDAPGLEARGLALAAADRALADTATLIPIGRPIRWSLVSPRLRAFQPNAHAVHPLDQLRRPR